MKVLFGVIFICQTNTIADTKLHILILRQILANTTIVQARAVVYHAWLEWLKAFLTVSGWLAGWLAGILAGLEPAVGKDPTLQFSRTLLLSCLSRSERRAHWS